MLLLHFNQVITTKKTCRVFSLKTVIYNTTNSFHLIELNYINVII